MAQRHYLMLADGSTIEVTDRVESFEGWEFTEKAEEGAFGSGVIWLSDPDMDLDVDGLRAYFVLEDASEATDNVLWGGFVVDPEVSRGEQGTTHYDPLARAWQLQLTDRNGYWNRRVMVGTDCKRPAESDVTRMQWLLTTSEASWLDDATTYLATGSPSNMDKVDYRGQYLNQILDDCAQHTGKNWWVQLQESGSGRKNVGWYGLDGLTDYTSDILLSNDPTDWLDDALLDGTSLTWPIADQTKLRRDTSRVYSGVYLRYANGTKAIYRRRAASVTAYGYRDYVTDYPNVKTKAKAIARATRLLNDLANPDERITTTVRLPRGKATMLRAGMRVQFRATHLEGYSSWNWLRVLSVSIKPIGIGDQYDLALELQGPGTPADPVIVQSAFDWATAASNCQPVFPDPVRPGDILLMILAVNAAPSGASVPSFTVATPFTTHEWTDYQDATQFPGPGARQALGAFSRVITTGEAGSTAPVVVSVPGSQAYSMHLFEIRGGTVVDSSVATGTYSLGGGFSIANLGAGLMIGASTTQTVSYGSGADISGNGTTLFNGAEDGSSYPANFALWQRIAAVTDGATALTTTGTSADGYNQLAAIRIGVLIA